MNLTKISKHSPIMSPRLLFVFLLILYMIAPVSVTMAQKQLLTQLSEDSFLVKNSGLIWQYEKSDKIANFMNMKNYVLLSEAEGWRLPTKQELHELFEIFDLHRNGAVKIDIEGSYWLTDDSGHEVIGAWEIGDQCGPSRTYYPHKRGYIRLVRTE